MNVQNHQKTWQRETDQFFTFENLQDEILHFSWHQSQRGLNNESQLQFNERLEGLLENVNSFGYYQKLNTDHFINGADELVVKFSDKFYRIKSYLISILYSRVCLCQINRCSTCKIK